MAYSETLSRHLEGLEEGLRQLAAEAAGEGAWVVVRAASQAAEALNRVIEAPIAHQDTSERTDDAASRTDRLPPAGPARDYPRFERAGNDLIKVGRSKKDNTEYRHKAPWALVGCVINGIRELAKSNGRFASDELMPVIDPRNGEEVPTYQVYLTIRWLRALRLISADGRSEYRVHEHDSLHEDVSGAWQALEA